MGQSAIRLENETQQSIRVVLHYGRRPVRVTTEIAQKIHCQAMRLIIFIRCEPKFLYSLYKFDSCQMGFEYIEQQLITDRGRAQVNQALES